MDWSVSDNKNKKGDLELQCPEKENRAEEDSKEIRTIDSAIKAHSNIHSSSKVSNFSQNSNSKEANAIDKKLMNLASNKKDSMLFLIQVVKN